MRIDEMRDDGYEGMPFPTVRRHAEVTDRGRIGWRGFTAVSTGTPVAWERV
jgi:hypothetical protein